MQVPIATAHEPFKQIWENISAAIQPQVSPDTFQRWFAAIGLVRADEQELTLRVPNNIYQFWIESNYMPLVQSAIMGVLGAPRHVRFVFKEKAETDDAAASTTVADEAVPGPSHTALRNYAVDIAHSSTGAEIPAHGLNPRYTFDSFVVGENCRYAQAASRAVSETPAKTYNPLFLYGGVGLGKTHLMQAIGQATLI